MNSDEHILLIANPAAQSGRGAAAAQKASNLLSEVLGEGAVDLMLTQAPRHAQELAANMGASYAAVVALGGDGVVHEVVNGLMQREPGERPALGVLPVGSGSDYARTLGIPFKLEEAVAQLLTAEFTPADLGVCNGQYFMETLSFGLDAAIALGTVERRKKRGKAGTMLYLEEGVDQLLHHLNFYSMTMHLSGKAAPETLYGEAILAAVQVGPTYGGGFNICPKARIDDGLLDVCVAWGPVSPLLATKVFLSAKNGHHVGHRVIELHQASKIEVSFAGYLQPQCQIDGERLEAKSYSIGIEPAAIQVLKAS